MKITKRESRQEYLERQAEWHPYFCWYPIQVGETEWRWLETIWRRREYRSCYDGPFWDTEYTVYLPTQQDR